LGQYNVVPERTIGRGIGTIDASARGVHTYDMRQPGIGAGLTCSLALFRGSAQAASYPIATQQEMN
jgi:hypothetical protein